jgi:hypothetical protein
VTEEIEESDGVSSLSWIANSLLGEVVSKDDGGHGHEAVVDLAGAVFS